MARKIITLEIDAEDEDLVRGYADFVGEIKQLAATAPDGSVLDACEEAVIEKGREHQRRLFQWAPRPGSTPPRKRGDAEDLPMRTDTRKPRRRLA